MRLYSEAVLLISLLAWLTVLTMLLPWGKIKAPGRRHFAAAGSGRMCPAASSPVSVGRARGAPFLRKAADTGPGRTRRNE